MVLGLSQDGACTNLIENLRENSLKGDLSNINIVNTPLFLLVNTFKQLTMKTVHILKLNSAGTVPLPGGLLNSNPIIHPKNLPQ
jgi:hypothetical protein